MGHKPFEGKTNVEVFSAIDFIEIKLILWFKNFYITLGYRKG